MRQILSVAGGIGFIVLFVWLKYLQVKREYSRNLGDGGIQRLFSNDR